MWEPHEKEHDMSMSKDRIHFFLPNRYFQSIPRQNGMHRETCVEVLTKAFGQMPLYQRLPKRGFPGCTSWEKLMDKNSDGFTIVCRPSQFARFIYYRYKADECINGIKDLRPELVPACDEPDELECIAAELDVSRKLVAEVACRLGHDDYCDDEPAEAVDVSGNFEKR
jgi:hypothetical protein